jgi:hypothetical protein
METLPVLSCYVGETNEPPKDGFRQEGNAMKFHSYVVLSLIALASCGPKRDPRQPVRNIPTPAVPAPSAPRGTRENIAVGAPEPENRANLPEPRAPIDPKSVEAAGQVVQHYGALIEERRFLEAAGLWGDATAAAKFAKQLDGPALHLEIGALGETEGAAGSIYTNVPVIFQASGFRRSATVILRRVNDVPGSTQEQRRWHIEQIQWDKAG